ncbi:hypothetical protein CALVIDRAFT_535896 [Calocera viscosa TUFC12733]|uniref:RanBP2-type domain-containing protein n=1 Tax=Calocera viscosa (strain TUFC12733) TaxID=1330018 RepID=A0A167NK69_CALVF|nr:hypothetical protein CALVIDRAFT_535896 [Calocera viscosa TUFC12733]
MSFAGLFQRRRGWTCPHCHRHNPPGVVTCLCRPPPPAPSPVLEGDPSLPFGSRLTSAVLRPYERDGPSSPLSFSHGSRTGSRHSSQPTHASTFGSSASWTSQQQTREPYSPSIPASDLGSFTHGSENSSMYHGGFVPHRPPTPYGHSAGFPTPEPVATFGRRRNRAQNIPSSSSPTTVWTSQSQQWVPRLPEQLAVSPLAYPYSVPIHPTPHSYCVHMNIQVVASTAAVCPHCQTHSRSYPNEDSYEDMRRLIEEERDESADHDGSYSKLRYVDEYDERYSSTSR